MTQIINFDFYTKKPITIKAAKLTELVWQKLYDLPNHVAYIAKGRLQAAKENNIKYFLVVTLEGTMRGNLGDILIVGVKGELYPCKPDIFKQTYEKVDESEIK